MAVLAQMNEDLKEFNPDYYKTKNLIRHNTIQMLKTEKDEPRNEMLRVFKLAEKEVFKKHQKAQLIDSRRLSDGSLECVFKCEDWEIFTQNYSEKMNEDYEDWTREKSNEYKTRIENEKQKFNSYWNSRIAPVAGVKEIKKVSRLN